MNKPRYFVLTDVSAEEPDDQQSLVRLILYACDIDIEGLVATSSQWKEYNKTGFRADIIHKVLDAYETVEDNLRLHRPEYPTAEYLRSTVAVGNGNNMESVGDGKDSKGSDLLVERILADDPRPLWVGIWGGASTLAQALWKLKATLPPEVLHSTLEKVWVYEIQGQDDAGAWIAVNFPELKFIRSQLIWRSISTHLKGDWFDARGDYEDCVSPTWYKEHIQTDHGPLGDAYPDGIYLHEGDTPSILHLVPSGLHDPTVIDQGGWGGRYEPTRQLNVWSGGCPVSDEGRFGGFWMFSDAVDVCSWNVWSNRPTRTPYNTLIRWRSAYQNDFAARMDWCLKSPENANHAPYVVIDGDESTDILERSVNPGQSLESDASASTDPDGDRLAFHWWIYPEAGSYPGTISLENVHQAALQMTIPADASGCDIHLIIAVTDDGDPPLTAYRRVILHCA